MEDPSNILFWEEDDVHAFLCGLGFKGYEAQIKEHQINGEILVQCDHEALKDVGIHSVGHRLAILKAVYQLKLQYDVPIEEGHWVPPSEFIDQVMVDSPAGVIPPDRMFELLRERDDRILSLESSISRLSEQLNGMRDEVYGINKALYTKEPPIPINKLRPNQASPTSSGFPRAHLRNGSAHLIGSTPGPSGSENSPSASPMNSPVRSTHEALHSVASSSSSSQQPTESASNIASNSGAGGLSYSSSIRRRVNNYFGTSTAAHHNGLLRTNDNNNNNIEQSPPSPNPGTSSLLSSTAAGFTVLDPPTPTATTYHHASSSGNNNNKNENDASHAVETIQSAAMTPSNRPHIGSAETDGAIQIPPPTITSTASSSLGLQSQRPATAQAMSTSPGGTSLVLPNRPSTSAETPSGSSSTANSTGSTSSTSAATEKKASSSSSSSADNPYKSFRVTLEDPCYKVLPAALKKYKINDDWRQYALFICYGNQERCLSYDEKPLSLFQKLKDSNQNPVFMLRHIKDIKSPIVVAHAKHAARKEKRLKEGKHVIGEGREGSIREFTRATRLHHPTNLQPVKGSPNSPNPGGNTSSLHDDKDKGKNGTGENKDDDGNEKNGTGKDHHGLGYALAIYPYMADRDDEFDVNVGDTFVILNKTKGWWVVHRDTKATKESDIVRSGWVPQGCLLETSVPPSKMSSTPLSAATPINPLSIVSVSTPGLALMDYTAKGSDEITMKKGDKLRVFKRYNFWSYVIKENTGERGWTPSWFVGKFSSSSTSSTSGNGGGGGHSATSTPTSALTTGSSGTSHGSLHTPSSATPLSAFPISGSARKDHSLSGAGDTTPTSATMATS